MQDVGEVFRVVTVVMVSSGTIGMPAWMGKKMGKNSSLL